MTNILTNVLVSKSFGHPIFFRYKFKILLVFKFSLFLYGVDSLKTTKLVFYFNGNLWKCIEILHTYMKGININLNNMMNTTVVLSNFLWRFKDHLNLTNFFILPQTIGSQNVFWNTLRYHPTTSSILLNRLSKFYWFDETFCDTTQHHPNLQKTNVSAQRKIFFEVYWQPRH